MRTTFLPESNQRSVGERFANAMHSGLGAANQVYQQYQEKQMQQEQQKIAQQKQMQENAALKRLGIDAEGIQDPKMRQMLLSETMKGQNEERKLGDKLRAGEQQSQEKMKAVSDKYQGAIDRVRKMKEIREAGNLGIGSKYKGLLGGETAKDRGAYQTLGKSLISFASTIPIRNQIEFDTLAHSLYDPDITDKEAEGVLEALERIIMDAASSEGADLGQSSPKSQPNKERPPLSSFHR